MNKSVPAAKPDRTWPNSPGLRLLITEIKIQFRAGFWAAYGIMTAFFFLLLALLPAESRETAFGLIVLFDPSFMGFFFAGGLVLLELEQGMLPVILTHGSGFASHWRAKATAILLLAGVTVALLTATSWMVGFINLRPFGLVLLALVLVLTVPVYLSLGLVLAARFPRVVDYFVLSGVALVPLTFPMVELVGISVGFFGMLSPIWGGIVLISSVFDQAARTPLELMAATSSLVIWNLISYRWARRAFDKLAGRNTTAPKRPSPAAKTAPSHHPTRARPGLRFWARMADVRLLLRDPMTAMVLFAPMLAGALLVRGLPWLLGSANPVGEFIPTAVAEYLLQQQPMDHLRSFVLLLASAMYGMLGAFLILDEKDAGVLPFLRTLPGPPGWYLLRRCRVLLVLYGLALVPTIFAGDLFHAGGWAFVISLGVDALILPMVFLGMGLLAKNKIQGLALAKVLNLCTLPPLLMLALPGRWVWLAGIIPTSWGSLIRLSASGTGQILVASLVGLVYGGGVVMLLYRRAKKMGD